MSAFAKSTKPLSDDIATNANDISSLEPGSWNDLTPINGWTASVLKYRLLPAINSVQIIGSNLNGSSATSTYFAACPSEAKPASGYDADFGVVKRLIANPYTSGAAEVYIHPTANNYSMIDYPAGNYNLMKYNFNQIYTLG